MTSKAKWFAIADRIDVEHEAQLNDAFETRNSDENQENDGWIRLPKDANGEYIHIRDVMEPNGSNLLFGQTSFEVRAIRYNEGGWEVYSRLGDRYATSLLRHHHEPTVEDVLREFGEKYCDTVAGSDKERELFAEYAAKLQIKESE
jgi:hypothetical protein